MNDILNRVLEYECGRWPLAGSADSSEAQGGEAEHLVVHGVVFVQPSHLCARTNNADQGERTAEAAVSCAMEAEPGPSVVRNGGRAAGSADAAPSLAIRPRAAH